MSEQMIYKLNKYICSYQGALGMQLISPETLAKTWQVPLSWVYTGIRKRTIPHIKLGHYVRFDEEEVQQWLAERRRGSKEPYEEVVSMPK
jgi:excisionase family DNA binding protein